MNVIDDDDDVLIFTQVVEMNIYICIKIYDFSYVKYVEFLFNSLRYRRD